MVAAVSTRAKAGEKLVSKGHRRPAGPLGDAVEDPFVAELDELLGLVAELSAAARQTLRQVLEALVGEGLEPRQECAALRVLDTLASLPRA